MQVIDAKQTVKDYWESRVCGSQYGEDWQHDRRQFFAEIDKVRYEQDYMLTDFAQFNESAGKKVLEVGLGTGADFIRWVRAGAEAYGRDLTQASINLVKERLSLEGLNADVAVGDAEALKDFPDNFFDIYYSWGVLHHTPDTEKAFAEAYRVLKPGGQLKVMLYHNPSVGAFVIWMLYGPLRLKFRSLRSCYGNNVESPGTKMYTKSEAEALIGKFFKNKPIEVKTFLGAGDLLTHKFNENYTGFKWKVAKALYPRWIVKHILGHRFGTVMTITTVK